MSDPNLTLHYNSAVDQTLVARIGPTPGITRTTSATFFNSSGLIETEVSGVARFEYDPVTRISLGLLVEEARTNLCLQSETFDATPWTTLLTPIINKAALAPDGSNNATNLNDNNGAGFEAVVQQITIPDDSADYTFSLFILKTAAGSAPTMGVNIVLIGGTDPGDLPIPRIFTDTGFVQDLQAGANSRIVDAGTHWRLESTVGNNSTGNTIIEIQIYPATAANGFLPNIAAAIGINTVWGAQMEIGAFATSYIPTVASSVTRNLDDVQTSDVGWVNDNFGTFYFKGSFPIIPVAVAPLLQIDDGDSADRFFLEQGSNSTTTVKVKSQNDGDTDGFVSQTAISDATLFRAAAAYADDDLAFSLDGQAVGTDSSAAFPTAPWTRFFVGRSHTTQIMNGHIAELRYYNVRKDNQFLESLSNGIINEDSINLFTNLARPIVRKLARPY